MPKELRLGVSALNQVRFNHEISNPDYLQTPKFNNLELISLDPVTLSYDNLVSFARIILNSSQSLCSVKIEINLRLLIHISDKKCQQQLTSLITDVIPSCNQLKHLSFQFIGITDQLYHHHSLFLNQLFETWINMHQIHLFPKLKSITLKFSLHLTKYLVRYQQSNILLQFLTNHPTLSCVNLKLSDFSRNHSPISFIPPSNSTGLDHSKINNLKTYIQSIFKALYNKQQPLTSFYLTTFDVESNFNDILNIIKHAPTLKKFDIYSPQTEPDPDISDNQVFKVILAQFINYNEQKLTHFRCSYYFVLDSESLNGIAQFIENQVNLEKLNLSNCCFPNKAMSIPFMKTVQYLFDTMMRNLTEIDLLILPTIDVLYLSQYLDLCYQSLITSYHIWHCDNCQLHIPIKVDQEWIFNVCDNFNESQINTYFDPMQQFIERIINFQRAIYPKRFENLSMFLKQLLSKKYDLCNDVIDIIIEYGISQSKLRLQFIMNIPLLGTNYVRKMSQQYRRSIEEELCFIEIVDHCFQTIHPNLSSFYV